MAATPQYAATPINDTVVVSAANTNRDGTGTIVDITQAGATGALIDAVVVQAIGTTTAGMVRLFTKTGSTYRLIDEIPVAAVTPSGTVAAFRERRIYALTRSIPLEPNQWLAASTHNAESFHATAEGGHL